MRRNGITIFLLHVAQCITFRQTNIFTATVIAKALLKSFYLKLAFKVILMISRHLPISKRLVTDLITSQENLKHSRKNQLAYNLIKPSHDVLQLFMTIEYTLMKIEMRSKI